MDSRVRVHCEWHPRGYLLHEVSVINADGSVVTVNGRLVEAADILGWEGDDGNLGSDATDPKR